MDDSLKRLLKNYSNARRSWEVWCFMVNYNVKTSRVDLPRHFRKDSFLSHYLYLSLKDYYIEMYKIVKYSKKNEDNIFALLQTQIDNKTNRADQAKICLDELNKIESIIKTICNIRDKFYAHLDKDYQDYIYKGVSVEDDIPCFIAIEKAIIALTSTEILQSYLDEIPSRDDFAFTLNKA
jgi:hypothetical protein